MASGVVRNSGIPSVSEGGTGATTAAAARVNLGVDRSWVQLWSNSSTNTFSTQTILLDTSGYSYLLIAFRHSNGSDSGFLHFIYVKNECGASCILTDMDMSSTDFYVYKRDLIALSDHSGVLFGDCVKRNLNTTTVISENDNSQLIPFAIWGR